MQALYERWGGGSANDARLDYGGPVTVYERWGGGSTNDARLDYGGPG